MKETMSHPLSGMGVKEIGALCYEWAIALRASVADSRQYGGKDNNGGMVVNFTGGAGRGDGLTSRVDSIPRRRRQRRKRQ
jgi:hypothetical protein